MATVRFSYTLDFLLGLTVHQFDDLITLATKSYKLGLLDTALAMRYAMNADKDEWKEFSDEMRLSQKEIESKKAKEGIAGLMKLFGN